MLVLRTVGMDGLLVTGSAKVKPGNVSASLLRAFSKKLKIRLGL